MTTIMKDLAYWIGVVPQHQREDEGAQKITLRALCALELYGTKEIDAETSDGILGLNPGTTQFFNHDGVIPASILINELTRKAGCPLPEYTMDITKTSKIINLCYAELLLAANPSQA